MKACLALRGDGSVYVGLFIPRADLVKLADGRSCKMGSRRGNMIVVTPCETEEDAVEQSRHAEELMRKHPGDLEVAGLAAEAERSPDPRDKLPEQDRPRFDAVHRILAESGLVGMLVIMNLGQKHDDPLFRKPESIAEVADLLGSESSALSAYLDGDLDFDSFRKLATNKAGSA